MGLFDGKVAIITGVARGLGFDYATYFLQDGAYIVLGDINCAAVQEAAASLQTPEKTLGVCLDVTDLASTRAMTRQVMEKFGRADILVNSVQRRCRLGDGANHLREWGVYEQVLAYPVPEPHKLPIRENHLSKKAARTFGSTKR